MARTLINGEIVSFIIVKAPIPNAYMIEMWIGKVITPIYWTATSVDAARLFIPKSCVTCVENKNPLTAAIIEEWY